MKKKTGCILATLILLCLAAVGIAVIVATVAGASFH